MRNRPAALALLAALWFCGAASAENPRRPSFVILLADDLGYGDLGTFGHPTIATPNLDRMAAEGLKLTSFYAQPLCTPSRAALLTGRYPMRSGLYRVLFPPDTGGIPREEVTLAEALRDTGYRTQAIGKWHLGHRSPFFPTENGFDHYFGLLYSNDMAPPRQPTPLRLYRDAEQLPGEVDLGKLTEDYTAEAVRFLREAAHADRPFFLYLAYTMTHVPLAASERFAGRSRRGLYGDAVETIDWSVGEILRTLRENGLDDSTLVLFTSDNGGAQGPPGQKPHGPLDGGSNGLLRSGKGSTYEGGLREPFIVRWPRRIEPAQVRADPASTLDLLPTFLDLAGATAPAGRPLDGRSLTPLFDHRELPDAPFYYFRATFVEGVREGKWKLRETLPESGAAGAKDPPEVAEFVRRTREEHRVFTAAEVYGSKAVVELFDLDADSAERYDRSDEHPDLVARLRARMTEFAHGVTPGPAFDLISREEGASQPADRRGGAPSNGP